MGIPYGRPQMIKVPALPADVRSDPFFTGTRGPGALVATTAVAATSYALADARTSKPVEQLKAVALR